MLNRVRYWQPSPRRSLSPVTCRIYSSLTTRDPTASRAGPLLIPQIRRPFQPTQVAEMTSDREAQSVSPSSRRQSCRCSGSGEPAGPGPRPRQNAGELLAALLWRSHAFRHNRSSTTLPAWMRRAPSDAAINVVER